MGLGGVLCTANDGLTGSLTSKVVRVISGAVALPLLTDEERKSGGVVRDVWGLSTTRASAVVCQGRLCIYVSILSLVSFV